MSLRSRLLLWVGLLVVAAIAATAFLSTRLAENEFARIIDIEETVVSDPDLRMGLERAVSAITERYRQHGWSGIDGWLAREAGQRQPPEQLMLFSPGGELISGTDVPADASVVVSADNIVQLQMVRQGQTILREQRMPWALIRDTAGDVVARLFYGPPQLETDTTVEEARQQDFDAALRQAVLVGVVMVGLLALAVTAVATRRVTQPLADLTESARRLASGDFSQRVNAGGDDEVGRLAQAFNSMAEQLQKLDSARQDMVNDVAHELRTPLTNMRCQLEAVQDGLMKPDNALIDSLSEEALLLQRLVDDLRELALTRPHVVNLQRRPVELSDQVDGAIAACSVGADCAAVINATDQGVQLFVDPDRLQQILRNLIGNALRHTPRSGTVTVESDQRPGATEIRVVDTGEGLKENCEGQVFERFFRADPSRSRATGGAGLGLAIVRQLVEAHGGSVGVRPNKPRGSVFWFSLPVAGSMPGK